MHLRPVWAEVDLGAIRHNAQVLSSLVTPAQVCGVVKAQAYGHGPVRVAEAALAGGVSWLAVALVEEGMALRDAGITEPVLMLSEPPAGSWSEVLRYRLTPSVYSLGAMEEAAKAVAMSDLRQPLPLHLKVDTGMHRVGASVEDAVGLAVAVCQRPELRLGGLWTHFAVADEPDHPFTGLQLDRFRAVVECLGALGIRPAVLHACNSAAILTQPSARFDVVRAGIALYGLAPSPALAGCLDISPALALKARVSFVKEVAAGERVSYGLRYGLEKPTVLATVPIGYADGVPRRLSEVGGQVLVGGKLRPIAGTVTMDQLMVDCGDDRSVQVGDEVVLIGTQRGVSIDAWDWARRLGTIAYEIVCGISSRVPRIWTSSGAEPYS